MSETTVKKHNRTHKWAFPVGLIIVLLAVVGLVFIIVSSAKGISKAFDNSKQIEEYNKLLRPVVMNDPANFDDVTLADKKQLADIAIWSILVDELTPQKYEYTDEGMVIPAEDVEKKFHELFGKDTEMTHATIEGYGYTFTFDSAENNYVIPLTGIVPVYTPRVVDISKKGSATILTVGLLAGNEWAQTASGDMVAPEPDKYVRITLRADKDGTAYISAIQGTDAPETVTTAEALTVAEDATVLISTTAAPESTAEGESSEDTGEKEDDKTTEDSEEN
ncbi:MAG: hypothetical protein K5755_02075 [Clostridiales bacterium]|nr:hypothetical protein [Clostridia bacterium]MCR4563407.1 hypothetical protein [Clostridiales bacterium]